MNTHEIKMMQKKKVGLDLKRTRKSNQKDSEMISIEEKEMEKSKIEIN